MLVGRRRAVFRFFCHKQGNMSSVEWIVETLIARRIVKYVGVISRPIQIKLTTDTGLNQTAKMLEAQVGKMRARSRRAAIENPNAALFLHWRLKQQACWWRWQHAWAGKCGSGRCSENSSQPPL